MEEIVRRIKERLGQPLPGLAAQVRMMPERRRLDSAFASAGGGRTWRRAAVLILIYPGPQGLTLPLTLRRHDLAHHAGQISFPGGTIEAGESVEEAAFREAREEIGIDPSSVEILGRLTALRIPPSGFEIDPVVAWIAARPTFVLEASEVAELIELPLARLLETDAVGEEEWEIAGGKSLVPFWRIGKHKVWGATGMVLGELGAVIQGIPGFE